MRWELKIALARYNKTIKGLAEELRIGRNTASRWVNSRRMPKIDQDKLEAIADYVGCPIPELIVFEETDFKSGRQAAGRRVA
ncbi:MAG: helix-turn-helix transcriptional regulator [Microcoleaceae cyanobacterium]